MKMHSTLKDALAACEKIAAERTKLNAQYQKLTQTIDTAAAGQETALKRLGAAMASDDLGAIEQARQGVRDGDLDQRAATEGRRAVSSKLADLHASSQGPLKALAAEIEVWRGSVRIEAQKELTAAAEVFAITLRRLLAITDAAGVATPLGKLNSLPGITEPVTLATDWRADQTALRSREPLAGPVGLLRDLEGFAHEVRARRNLEVGHAHERPKFEAVAHHRVFMVLQSFRADRAYVSGDVLSADAVNPVLLRQLYEGRFVTTQSQWDAGNQAAAARVA